jgi:hypothetical protein
MIRGYFDNKKCLVSGEFSMEYQYTGASFKTNFLIDTGSDDVILSDRDAKRLRLKYNLLGSLCTLRGIGSLPAYRVDANIYFQDAARFVGYRQSLYIAEQGAGLTMSILGQDILSRWSLKINHSQGALELEPVSSDFTIP